MQQQGCQRNRKLSRRPRCTIGGNSVYAVCCLLFCVFCIMRIAEAQEGKPELLEPAAKSSSTDDSSNGSSQSQAWSLPQAVLLGAQYLEKQCDEDGRFSYRRNLDPDREKKYNPEKYNLLRHAGAIYALAMVQRQNPAQKFTETIKKACLYLQSHMGKVKAWPGAIAVWSDPDKLGGDEDDDPVVKLGGNGLALIALSDASNVDGVDIPLSTLQGLGMSILHMQRADGSFQSKYSEEPAADADWISLFYPGEAMLGLLKLYELDQDPKWLKAAMEGAAYLTRDRKKIGQYPPDHWFLLMAERLWRYWDKSPSHPMTRDELKEHVTKICNQMLDRLCLDGRHPAYGSFGETARTCPTAIRLEGLLATGMWMSDDRALINRINVASELACTFLLLAQVRGGELAGGIPRTSWGPVDKALQAALLLQDRRAGEIRIDYVQHAICAMMWRMRFIVAQGASR